MCARFFIISAPQSLRKVFTYAEQPNFPPRYNIAPTDPVPVVVHERGERHFMLMRWGFLPSWVKDPADYPLVINIRSETALEKPSFRTAIMRRRALMPADGFYEWRKEGRQKIPHRIRRVDQEPLAFAALWDTWVGKDGSEIDTVAIMTQQARGPVAELHDRMPLMIPLDRLSDWLDPMMNAPAALDLALSSPVPELVIDPVSTRLNKAGTDGEELWQSERLL